MLIEGGNYYQGLFGSVFAFYDVTAFNGIKNLSIIDANISADTEDNGLFVGGIAGSVYGYIENCYFSGTVTGGYCVGGIVGSGSEVYSCTNEGTITGGGDVGGITGSAFAVKDCNNKGAVKGNRFVGGVSGDADIIYNCNNSAVVSGEGESGYAIGGISGMAYTVYNCFNIAAVYGSDSRDAGGIIGQGLNPYTTPNRSDLSSMVEEAHEEAHLDNLEKSYGKGSALGRSGTIMDEHYTLQNCYNTGEVYGRQDVGGIIGYVMGDTNKIMDSYNAGAVSGTEMQEGFLDMYMYMQTV